MPRLTTKRLTVLTVGLLLGSLPVTGTHLLEHDLGTATDVDLRLVARGCDGFSPRDVLRGTPPRNGPTCRPVGIDGGVVRTPIAKADKRDRRNYGSRRAHGRGRHHGTDFRARCGTPVRAAHSGRAVVLKGRPGQLDRVGVSTGPRRLTTWYGHLRSVSVRNGAMVGGGRRLGRIGRTHRRSPCFLHFSVHLVGGARDPHAVNPSAWWRLNVGSHVSGLPPGDRSRGVFVASSFNVLGHSHTARGGKKRRQFAGSRVRMHRTVRMLRSNNVTLVGLQEFQSVQRRMFLRKTHGWKVYSPRNDPQDSIGWHTSRFRLLKSGVVRVPYFNSLRPMPIVRLRDRATGRAFVVISVHNPANRGQPRKMGKRRAVAVRRELAAVKRVRRGSGLPVVLMGDFNDRSREFYCRMTRHGLKASSGGTRGRDCRPSIGVGIDWVFGTRGIKFHGHQKVLGGLVARTTDHPVVLVRVKR